MAKKSSQKKVDAVKVCGKVIICYQELVVC